MTLEQAISMILTVSRDAITEKNRENTFSSELYVRPEAGGLFDINRKPLFNIMQDFLMDPNTCTHVLIGNPGAGKTTFAKKWISQYLDEHDKIDIHSFIASENNPNTQACYLPIFIPLIQILRRGKEHKAKSVFKNILEQYFDEIGIDKSAIYHLKKSVRLLIFLDGYDEIAYEGNLFIDNAWQHWSHCKFFISTRPEKFGDALARSELLSALNLTFSTTGSIDNDPCLVKTCLRDFNDADIQLFIQEWAKSPFNSKKWSPEQYWQRIESLKDLKDLAINPVILRLILVMLPTLYKKFEKENKASRIQLTRLNIYREFVDNWFKRQVGIKGHDKSIIESLMQIDTELYDLINTQARETQMGIGDLMIEYLYRYTRNLAYQSLIASETGKFQIELLNETTLNVGLLYDVSKNDLFIKSLSPKHQTILIKLLRKGCLLRCDKNYFRFFHKSIIEYFTELHIQNSVVGLSDIILKHKAELANPELNARLSELSLNQQTIIHEYNLRKFLVEQCEADKLFEEVLVDIIMLSKKYHDINIAAGNAITILNQANYPLNRLNLSGIHIRDADLSRSNLHLVDFTGAEFIKVNFTKAFLNDANLTDVNLNDCNFGNISQIKYKDWRYAVNTCLFTQNGHWFITGKNDGAIHLFDTKDWMIKQTTSQKSLFSKASHYEVTCFTTGCRFDPKTKTQIEILISGSKIGEIFFWKLPSLNFNCMLKGHDSEITHLISHFSQHLLVSASWHNIYLWNTDTGELLTKLNNNIHTVNALTFYSTEILLTVSCKDSAIHFWNINTGEEIKTIQSEIKFHLPTIFHPNRLLLAVCFEKNNIYLWDIDNNKKLNLLTEQNDQIDALAFHDNQRILASASRNSTIDLWNIDTGENYKQFRNDSFCHILLFHPTQSLLVSINISGKDIDLINVDIEVKSKKDKSALAFGYNFTSHPVKPLCAYKSEIKSIHLINAETGLLHTELEPPEFSTNNITFHPTQPLLAASNDSKIFIWNSETGQKLRELIIDADTELLSIIFHPTRTLLACSLRGGSLILWDTSTGEAKELKSRIYAIKSLVFHARQPLLAGASYKGSYKNIIYLFNTNTGHAYMDLKGHSKSVETLIFSPIEEKLLVSGSEDKTIRLWNTETGKEIKKLEGHQHTVVALSFHHTQPLLASFSFDRTIRLWLTEKSVCTQIISIGRHFPKPLFFTEDNILKAGYSIKKNCGLMSFTQNPLTNKYQLDNFQFNNMPSTYAQGVDLTKVNGLRESQYICLTEHCFAAGKPYHFAMSETDLQDIEEEKKHLFELRNLIASLKINADDALQETPSLFPGEKRLNIGYYRWQIAIIRLTKTTIPLNQEGCSSSSNTNRHVYGLIEGLNALGRRVWIRIDLINDSRYARIKNVCRIAYSNDENSAKKAFLSLFNDGRSGTPLEIKYHVAGALTKDQMISMLEKMIIDQQKQYGLEQHRILYKTFGGQETSTQISHNCLTWLRAHFSVYGLEIPQAKLDRIIVNPAHVINEYAFFKKRDEIHPINISDWDNDLPTPSLM